MNGVGLPTPAGRDMLGWDLQQATQEGDKMTQSEKILPYPVYPVYPMYPVCFVLVLGLRSSPLVPGWYPLRLQYRDFCPRSTISPNPGTQTRTCRSRGRWQVRGQRDRGFVSEQSV